LWRWRRTIALESKECGCQRLERLWKSRCPNQAKAKFSEKFYHENVRGELTHCDLCFENGKASFAAAGYPRKMIVVLVARDREESIDEWYYDSDQSFRGFGMPLNPGAEIEESEENLENLIQSGESETLEFKEKVPEKWRQAATVSAFANSEEGGRLLIGVNDSCEIVGCEPDNWADRFTNIIHSHCELAPSFSTSVLNTRGANIGVVSVAPGSDKPYAVKDQGIFVRVGATTRRANRYELDRLYASRQSHILQ
jgi:hypothetical protein